MLIELSEEQQRKLFEWLGPLVEAEVDSEVAPSGYTLQIEVGPPLEPFAIAVKGSSTLELGEVGLKVR